LAVDEAVTFGGVAGVTAFDRAAQARMAPMTASSARAWAGQHFWLAARRRSPFAIK
jgi:hypothetical protein